MTSHPIDLTGKSPLLIQIATLFSLGVAVFFGGYQGRAIIDEQRQTAIMVREIKEQLIKMNLEKWSYPMQREYNESISDLNNLTAPAISEIRERHYTP